MFEGDRVDARSRKTQDFAKGLGWAGDTIAAHAGGH